MRLWRTAGLGAWLLALACDSGGSGEPKPATTASAPVLPAPPAPPPPTPKTATTFASKDGAALSGDLYLARPDAPAVLLVHRLHGDRSELSPLAERLARAEKRYTVLSFDLRGHGDSKAPEKDKAQQPRRFVADVEAAMAHVSERAESPVPRLVLVGSSFGATLVSLVASQEPKVSALALISPGGAIEGVDLYTPYAAVRERPTFLAGAEDDNVTRDPLAALAKMAKRGTHKTFGGKAHSAGHLAAAHASLWEELERWLVSVYDEPPSAVAAQPDESTPGKR